MNISREAKKEEAIWRMRKMGLVRTAITQFVNNDYVCVSEPPQGFLFFADGKTLDRIAEVEEKTDGLVYLVVRSYTIIGMMDSFFYVSDYMDEWKLEHEDIKAGQHFSYVHNHDAPECSEFGPVGFERTAAGGIVRVW